MEKLGTVDESEMMRFIYAVGGVVVANIVAGELDVVFNADQPSRPAAQVIVKHARAFIRPEPIKPLPPVTGF
jgi:hypothetical protein